MANATSPTIVVVGAGAAGLVTAIFAARAGLSVVVLETRPSPGAKIRVSGGGRCNVLPSSLTLSDFHTSGSTHAMRNILFSWPLDQARAFFEEDLGVPLKVEATGKVFPVSNRSRDIVDALLGALARSGAELRAPCRVTSIEKRDDGAFRLLTTDGRGSERRSLECGRLVLATGGMSLPKSGSDGAGLEMATAFGHTRVPSYPALVPLLSSDSRWSTLAGVSARVAIAVESKGRTIDRRQGDLLVTHRGFSGPVVLDVSHHVTRGDGDVTLRVLWGGDDAGVWDKALRERGPATVGAALRRHLPERLGAILAAIAGIDTALKLSELTRESRLRLVATLSHYALPVEGSEGYATAEVTGGGVPLAEVVTATLESRRVPGLYFCGEILDVTGRLGGYNFLWAWVTGYRVAKALS